MIAYSCVIRDCPWWHTKRKNKKKNAVWRAQKKQREARTNNSLKRLRRIYGEPPWKPDEIPDVTVWIAGGTTYHRTEDCQRLRSGQRLAVWTDEDRPSMRPCDVEEVDVRIAAWLSYQPCTACKPEAVYPSMLGETYGHKPIDGFVEGYGLTDVCARCFIPCNGRHIGCYDGGYRILWPCTSAVLYGLAGSGETWK